MSEPEQIRKHALECLRLEADCMQLAGDSESPKLRSHFLRMAHIWFTLGVPGPSAIAAQERAEGETQTSDRWQTFPTGYSDRRR
jgi:hypothetical protein